MELVEPWKTMSGRILRRAGIHLSGGDREEGQKSISSPVLRVLATSKAWRSTQLRVGDSWHRAQAAVSAIDGAPRPNVRITNVKINSPYMVAGCLRARREPICARHVSR